MTADRIPSAERVGSPTPALTPARWQQVTRVVDAALELPPAERTLFAIRACAEDTALLGEVERLLDACARAESASDFLSAPAGEFAAPVFAQVDVWTEAARAAVPGALAAALAGRYAIERELARGGMATVYLATDERHQRRVALKVIDPELARGTGTERFLREIRIAARLQHPHIVPLHDSGNAGGLLYYVMPYVEGESLRARLGRPTLVPVVEAVRVLRDVAGALAYAHRQGVVHRDIKPENVLLDADAVLVADFGIAKALAVAFGQGVRSDGVGSARDSSPLTSVGVAIGTPAYMAPEQVRGDPTTDHRADLYALGVVAYELLAGVHPFGVRAPHAMLAAHLNEPPRPLAERRGGVPPALVALVMRLLQKHPADRPQSADEVLDALGSASGPSGPSGPSGGVTPPTDSPASPRAPRRAVALGGAALLVAAALLGAAVALARCTPSEGSAVRSGSIR